MIDIEITALGLTWLMSMCTLFNFSVLCISDKSEIAVVKIKHDTTFKRWII